MDNKQLYFAQEKAKNDAKRMTVQVLRALSEALQGQHITVDGKQCKLKPFGGVPESYLLVDVLEPGGGFDHIELKIEVTGWGRGV